MLTLYKGEIKGKKNYEAKFSTISILKDETGKNKFKKSITIITKIQQKQKKKSKIVWITIVIHNAMGVNEK